MRIQRLVSSTWCLLWLLLLLPDDDASVTSFQVGFVVSAHKTHPTPKNTEPYSRVGSTTARAFPDVSQKQQPPRTFTDANSATAAAATRTPTALFSTTTPNGGSVDEDDKETTTTTSKQQEQVSLDWQTIGRQLGLFREMAGPYYSESQQGRRLLAGLLGLTVLNSGVSVLFSYLGKDFWNALSAKDTEVFLQVLERYLGALVLGAPIVTLYQFQREQLAVHWREWMTARTFSLYTSNRVYYNLQQTEDDIDNPDQRITEDVKTFTAYSLQLLTKMLTSAIDLVSFSVILWSIYPQLFAAIIVYATAGTVITALLGKPLVHLNFQQLQREADLRYSLVRLRDNAESIAFYAGEDLEGQAVEARLENATDNKRAINRAQRNLEFFTVSYRYLIQIVPVAVVAPRYFAGAIELGVISQSAGAFNHILSDLSIIINQFEQLSTFSAGIERLSTFFEAMRDSDPQRREAVLAAAAATNGETAAGVEGSGLLQMANATTTSSGSSIALPQNETTAAPIIVTTMADPETKVLLAADDFGTIDLQEEDSSSDASPTVLSIDRLDLCTPDKKRTLIRNLSLELEQGENLLIVGNSGAGKSSLLRAVAGLWTQGNGSIRRPAADDVYFLPQRPYCTLGSLKDQLLYPSLDYNLTAADESSLQNKIVPRSHLLKETLTDQDLVEILEQIYLLDVAKAAGDGDPVQGLHSVYDWSSRLSLGEQQRLAFGRLLVNRPKLVILDEATSALDLAGEARMYNLLQTMARKEFDGKQGLSAPGLTYISVGHRPSLLAFHDKRLFIGGGTEHELTNVEKSSLQIPSKVPDSI